MSNSLSPEELQKLYSKRFEGKSAYRNRVWKVLVNEFFSQWIPESATVLDLGCGHCEFINQVNAAKCYGMDLNPDAVRNAAPNVEIISQNCAELWALPNESLDVVFTSNFFEHLLTKQDLRETLIQAYRCLKPNGKLIALGPNIRYLPGQYWDFYDHYVALTEVSLAEVLTECSFVPSVRISRFLPYTMSHGGEKPIWILSVYLRCRFLWRFFGKQFLVVGLKP